MTLPALAELDDLTARLEGELSGTELTRAQAALDDASTEVRFAAGTSWVDDDDELVDDIPDIVVKTTLEVAARGFLNPADGTRQESLGDHAKTLDSQQGIYLTDEEAAKVRAAAGTAVTGGIGVLHTTRGPIETASVRRGLLDCDDEFIW